jgi:DNA-directed RNA polymerase specialized sigma subunit
MVFVHGLYKALEKYDLSQNVPFLYFAKYYYEHEIHEYIRSMRHGLTIPNADEDKMLRKAMALYREYGEVATQENIEKIAEQIDRSPKITCELITAGLRNTLFIPFYKEYCDEDSEETAEDVTSDNTFNPELELIRKEQSEAVWGAYNELDIGTQLMIADNLAFCPECHSIFEMKKDKNGEPVKVRRKKKTYKEIAMLNEMSEEESVRVSLERVYKYIRNNLKS